jgi:hypothetical protein
VNNLCPTLLRDGVERFDLPVHGPGNLLYAQLQRHTPKIRAIFVARVCADRNLPVQSLLDGFAHGPGVAGVSPTGYIR